MSKIADVTVPSILLDTPTNATGMHEIKGLLSIGEPQAIVEVANLGGNILGAVGKVDWVNIVGNDLTKCTQLVSLQGKMAPYLGPSSQK
jgi:hypothetical protein